MKDYELIDVSHTIEDRMITYRGLPGPIICDYMSREESRSHYSENTEFQIGKIEMVANTGTYLDSPFHRYVDGEDLSELDLESLANIEGIKIQVIDRNERAIGKEVFRGRRIRNRAVLIHTGWARHWRTDQYFEGHPYLSADAADHLLEEGVALVGIDSLNIDDTGDGKRPVHTILLGNKIPIVEHLRGLEQLPEEGFSFFAVPAKVKGLGTFPVRAFVIMKRQSAA